MAKKKKQVTRKKAKRTATKRASATTRKRPAAKRTKSDTSVDAILKRFAKERISNETQLATLKKKRDDLEAKSARLREQIGKLVEQEKTVCISQDLISTHMIL